MALMKEDVWLSRILEYPVWEFQGKPDPDILPVPGERSLTYAKVPVEHVAVVSELEERGFRVVDVNVTLEHFGPPPRQSSLVGSTVTVEPFRPEDERAALDIASSCFHYSRFHQDPLIPNEAANRIKREWVRSYVSRTRGLELLIAKQSGVAIGFLAVLQLGDARIIDLLGTDPRFLRRGVGTALMENFLSRYRQPTRFLAGSQVANTPSLAIYQQLGFRITRSSYVLHLHRGVQ